MNYLFTETGMKILESLSFTDTLYAFDFDGTLAPIVLQPSQARMKAKTASFFDRLTQLVPTAIISGRSLGDLRFRVNPTVQYLVGNHGLEGVEQQASSVDFQKQCQEWLSHLYDELVKKAQDPGMEIEEKKLSLAIHYRKSRKKRSTKKLITEVVKNLVPACRVIPGKEVFNLVPIGGPHKGMALTQLMKSTGLNCALYIGDDDTDEDVFSLPNQQIFSVRVGHKRTSSAKYYIRSQSEIDRLLQVLTEFRYDSKRVKKIL